MADDRLKPDIFFMEFMNTISVTGYLLIVITILFFLLAVFCIKLPKCKNKKMLTISILLIVYCCIFAVLWMYAVGEQLDGQSFIISPKARLQAIYNALHAYAEDNNGNFPPEDGALGLGLLRTNGYLTKITSFQHPAMHRQARRRRKYWGMDLLFFTNTDVGLFQLSEEDVDFHYRGGLNEHSPPNVALVWDKADNIYRYHCILLVNGKIKTIAPRSGQGPAYQSVTGRAKPATKGHGADWSETGYNWIINEE